jgi:outer membrane lipoprotein-sorting protein
MVRNEEAGWSNPKILAIFVLIFLCGFASGSAVTRSFLHARMAGRVSADANAAKVSSLDELDRKLHLTPDQKLKVTQVLDDYAKYYDNLETDRENVAEHGKRQILLVLNPNQQKVFLQSFRYPVFPGHKQQGQ